MDTFSYWLDGSAAGADEYASSASQKVLKRASMAKASASAAAKKAAKPAKKTSAKKAASKKKPDMEHAKLVRDSFTIPEDELQRLNDTKKKCLKAGIDIKKSELLRIGISLVHGLGLSRLKKEKKALHPIKTGRPKKSKLQ